MTISLIDDRELWDRTVDQSPYGLLFHKWDFLKIAEKHTGWKLLPYGIYQGTNLLSLFPLFYKKDFMLKSVFSPPPLSCIPYLGPTMNASYDRVKPNTRETQLQAVVDETSAAIKKLSPSYVYIQMPPAFMDIRPFKWNGFQETSHFTYIIDLDRPLDDIWASFGTKLRWNLKNVSKLPLQIRQVNDAETFYDIVTRRYAEQGLTFPMKGSGYLKELIEAFPDNLKMYFLYNGEEIASVITVCQYRGRMIHWMGNARLDSGIAGNDHMLWTLIKMAKEDGCKEFELQGAGDRRLWHYKSKYNPRLEVCYAASQKDPLGNAAEWAYFNLKRKTLALPHIRIKQT
ncbi:MAG TPA: GNAT family N-acetyltransferase [Methanocella sp.]|jgi:hypothetical protein